jgi:hypothetical protein
MRQRQRPKSTGRALGGPWRAKHLALLTAEGDQDDQAGTADMRAPYTGLESSRHRRRGRGRQRGEGAA